MHHTMPTKGINFDKTEIAQVSSIENYEKGFQSIPSQSLAFSLQSYKVYINFRYLHMLATNTRRDAYTHQPRRIQPSFAQAAQSIYLSIYERCCFYRNILQLIWNLYHGKTKALRLASFQRKSQQIALVDLR